MLSLCIGRVWYFDLLGALTPEQRSDCAPLEMYIIGGPFTWMYLAAEKVNIAN